MKTIRTVKEIWENRNPVDDGSEHYWPAVEKCFEEYANQFKTAQPTEGERCVPGCKNFTGGEIKHHKTCPFYPESLSKKLDEMDEVITTALDWRKLFEGADQKIKELETQLKSTSGPTDEERFKKWCEDYHKLHGMIEVPHDFEKMQKERNDFLLGIRISIVTTTDKSVSKYLTDVIAAHKLEP